MREKERKEKAKKNLKHYVDGIGIYNKKMKQQQQ